MTRPVPLTVIKGGINRLRIKGGASASTLYDLKEGYVTDAGTVKRRAGTTRTATLPAGTVGLVAFKNQFHVFATEIIDALPEDYVLHILINPNSDAITNIALTKIHYAKPFMGFLYVAAEFEDGNIYHYWLQSGGVWTASTAYKAGDIIEPTTANGLAYQATRLSAPFPSWSAGTPRTVGDRIEPTVYNDFFYTVVDTIGSNPISGQSEPTWPTEDGAQVIEDTNDIGGGAPVVTAPPSTNVPTSTVVERYGTGTDASNTV